MRYLQSPARLASFSPVEGDSHCPKWVVLEVYRLEAGLGPDHLDLTMTSALGVPWNAGEGRPPDYQCRNLILGQLHVAAQVASVDFLTGMRSMISP